MIPCRIRLLFLFGAVSCLLTACSFFRTTPPPNLVLIVFDTLRADHLSLYGYARPTTPNIDAFAERATVYRRCVSTAPWTLPAHCSLLTGKYPFEHGARTFRLPEHNRWPVASNPLSEDSLTLTEMFQQEGYRTAAFVANNVFLTESFQFQQGFERYRVDRLPSDQLNRRVYRWLEKSDGQPFLLFINYMDTHEPYNTAPRPEFLDHRFEINSSEIIDILYQQILPAGDPIPATLAQQLIDQYDLAIANLDEQFRLLIDRLRQLGMYDNTAIVLTSDHGEYLGEHRLVRHSKDVYQEALWVPLVIKAPAQETGRQSESLVSLAHVPKLILEAWPAEFTRRNPQLLESAPPESPILSENYYSRKRDMLDLFWRNRVNRVRTALFDWPYKYIHSSDGSHELYDLEKDPKETKNLLLKEPQMADQLRKALEDFKSGRKTRTELSPVRKYDKEELSELKALGYL